MLQLCCARHEYRTALRYGRHVNIVGVMTEVVFNDGGKYDFAKTIN